MHHPALSDVSKVFFAMEEIKAIHIILLMILCVICPRLTLERIIFKLGSPVQHFKVSGKEGCFKAEVKLGYTFQVSLHGATMLHNSRVRFTGIWEDSGLQTYTGPCWHGCMAKGDQTPPIQQLSATKKACYWLAPASTCLFYRTENWTLRSWLLPYQS